MLHENSDNRALAELEAESTAYIVCQTLGIDSSSYTFGYVTTWAGGGNQAIAGIKASGDRIQKTASAIVELLRPTAQHAVARGRPRDAHFDERRQSSSYPSRKLATTGACATRLSPST